MTVLGHPGKYGQAVHARHDEIQNHGIIRLFGVRNQLDRLVSIVSGIGNHAFALDSPLQQAALNRIVVNDKYTSRHNVSLPRNNHCGDCIEPGSAGTVVLF